MTSRRKSGNGRGTGLTAKYHKHIQTVPLITVRGNEATTRMYEVRVTGGMSQC